jgi:branched-chain amino acid aminotransferase
MEYIHKTLIADGKAVNNDVSAPVCKTVVYEVLRVIDGIPLFIEKHLKRLSNSATLLNKNLPFSVSQFRNLIDTLINENKVFLGNIKISAFYNESEMPVQTIIGFIPHSYPSDHDYKFGVKTVTSVNERINPKAKVQNTKLRNELNVFMRAEQAYEAILVHPDGYITEGSRSNLFFITGNKILTAPDDQVLSGITRENVIELCHRQKYDLEFTAVKYGELKKVEAAFITGTSPKILPISQIDELNLMLPHPVISDLIQKYDHFIADYLKMQQKTKKFT